MPAEMVTTDEEADETTAEGVEDADEAAAEEAGGTGDHLAEIEDGAGCAEIWEHLSRRRVEDDD